MLRSRQKSLNAISSAASVLPRARYLSCAVLACFASVSNAAPGSALSGDLSLMLVGQLGRSASAKPVTKESAAKESATKEPATKEPAPKEPATKETVATDAPGVTRVEADRVAGRNEVELTAEGRARLRRGGLTLTSDRLKLDQILNEVTAEGNVRLQQEKSQLEGPRARLNLDTSVGEFELPSYRFQRDPAPSQGNMRPVVGSGKADALQMEGQNQFRLTNASYTTCVAPDPDWYLKVRDLQLDYDRERGEGRGTTLLFNAGGNKIKLVGIKRSLTSSISYFY